MVYAANGATVLDGTVLGARFRHRERRAEAAAHRALVRRGRLRSGWSRRASSTRARAICWSPDHPATGCCWPAPASAPTRGRTPRRPPCSAARCCRSSWSTRATTTWTPRWPCSTRTPSPGCRRPSRRRSRALLAARFPDAVVAEPADAAVLGLNAVSDGRHVVLSAQAPRLAGHARRARFRAHPGRPVRAAQGRRRSRSAARWRYGHDDHQRDRDRLARAPGRRALRAQLPPAAGGGRARRGGLGHRRRGPPLPGLPGRVLRAELRPRPPGTCWPPRTASWTG